MSDFEVVRSYLHDGDGAVYPDGAEALSRIEAELARLREALEQVFREEGLTRSSYPKIWELMGW